MHKKGLFVSIFASCDVYAPSVSTTLRFYFWTFCSHLCKWMACWGWGRSATYCVRSLVSPKGFSSLVLTSGKRRWTSSSCVECTQSSFDRGNRYTTASVVWPCIAYVCPSSAFSHSAVAGQAWERGRDGQSLTWIRIIRDWISVFGIGLHFLLLLFRHNKWALIEDTERYGSVERMLHGLCIELMF